MLKFLPDGEGISEQIYQNHTDKSLLLRRYEDRLARAAALPVNLVPIFVGQLMRRGLRIRALGTFRRLLDLLRVDGHEPFAFLFLRLNRARPLVSFRIVKKRNRVLRLPFVLKPEAEWRLAVGRLVSVARSRRERTMAARLYGALVDLDNMDSVLLARKREDEQLAVQNLMYFRYMKKWKSSKRRVS